LRFLCCPACHGELSLDEKTVSHREIVTGFLKCKACDREYKIEDRIPDFLLTDRLEERDRRWMQEYDRMARTYDLVMCHLLPFFSLGLEPLERNRWVKRLQIQRGDMVLDVSTGTGRNIPFIASRIGKEGKLFAMDISRVVLDYAKRKVKQGWSVEFQRANAAYLPYKSGVFDAVMHVGGINTFGEKRKALQEMVRVAKPEGKIVIVDEGLAPGKEKSFIGGFLLRLNRLYWCKPPIDLLPGETKNLQVDWGILPLLGFLPFWPYYIMELQKF
jgi:ubiquinone/menaquinone biosynthesis C-methylase UbiE